MDRSRSTSVYSGHVASSRRRDRPLDRRGARARARALPRLRRPEPAQGPHRGLRHEEDGAALRDRRSFELKVLPSVSVAAERVRLGNAEWGSAPQMVEVGRFSTEIGLWSLVSGPVDVRSLELGDVSVLLETGKDGKGNWVLGEGTKPEEGQGGCGLARLGRDRGPGRHPQRQARQRACHLSRARQAGPRRAPRDAHHRARHGRPPGDLRQGPGRQVRDHVDGRAGAARRPLLGAGHPHGARGRGREPPARRQGRPGPPEPPRRRRPHPEGRARGRRHDAREPPPAGGRHRPPERRRPVEGQGRAHPGGRRREAR